LLCEAKVIDRRLLSLICGSPCLVHLECGDCDGDDERNSAERLGDAAPRLNAELGELFLIRDPRASPAFDLPAQYEPDRESADDERAKAVAMVAAATLLRLWHVAFAA
jgi:hypothetical protein